jgi:hypothetical protein
MAELVGGRYCIDLGHQIEHQKINKVKYMVALDSCRLTTAHKTTNQKQASTTGESIKRMCVVWEAWGKHNTIVLRTLKVGRR